MFRFVNVKIKDSTEFFIVKGRIIFTYISSSSSSFLGSTAQLRLWPPPQNPAEFLGGFSTIFFLQGRVVSPTPIPHPGGPGLCIYIPQRQGGYPF
jgi:hypothetical protein